MTESSAFEGGTPWTLPGSVHGEDFEGGRLRFQLSRNTSNGVAWQRLGDNGLDSRNRAGSCSTGYRVDLRWIGLGQVLWVPRGSSSGLSHGLSSRVLFARLLATKYVLDSFKGTIILPLFVVTIGFLTCMEYISRQNYHGKILFPQTINLYRYLVELHVGLRSCSGAKLIDSAEAVTWRDIDSGSETMAFSRL